MYLKASNKHPLEVLGTWSLGKRDKGRKGPVVSRVLLCEPILAPMYVARLSHMSPGIPQGEELIHPFYELLQAIIRQTVERSDHSGGNLEPGMSEAFFHLQPPSYLTCITESNRYYTKALDWVEHRWTQTKPAPSSVLPKNIGTWGYPAPDIDFSCLIVLVASPFTISPPSDRPDSLFHTSRANKLIQILSI